MALITKFVTSIFNNEKKLLLFFVLLSLCLTLPSLFNGFVLDDYFHRLRMLNIPVQQVFQNQDHFWGLFSFLNGDSAQTANLVSTGVLPWWVLPEIKYTFFRPLSELSIAVDYWLWPESALAMHFHSSLWFGLCVLAAGLFLFKTTTKPIAIVTLIFFIAAGNHGFAISWLASRNALIACAMSLFALYFAARFESENKGYFYYCIALAFHSLALFAGEIGITSSVFLCLYFLILSNDTFLNRVVKSLPVVVLTCLWIMLRAYLDYGAYGTGAYIDPFHSPVEFIESVSSGIGMAFFAMCSGIPVELLKYFLSTNAFMNEQLFLGLSILLLIFLLPLIYKNKRAYFYLLAGLFAIIPVLAGELQSRVLFLVSFPVLAFISECLCAFWEFHKKQNKNVFSKIFLSGPWSFSLYALTVLALIGHLLLAPLLLVYSQTLIASGLGNGLQSVSASLNLAAEDKDKVLILVNPPNASAAGYLPIMQTVEGKVSPKKMFMLSSASHGLGLRRINKNSLELVPEGGFLAGPMDRVMRSDKFPFKEGEALVFDGLIVNVTSLNEMNRPSKAVFYFPDNLDSEKYIVKCWQGSGINAVLQDCTLPTVGDTKVLEGVSF